MQIISHRQGNIPLHFCSLKCKREFQAELEGEDNERSESVLPEMRTVTARKTDQGIAIVSGDGGFHGRANSTEGERRGRVTGRKPEHK